MLSGSPILEADNKGQTPATRADGPSACPGDSSHERESVGGSDASWDMEQAEKSIRVRNAGRMRCVRGCLFCRVLRRTAATCFTARGAAGAVKRPVVPHAPKGEEDERETGEPCAGVNEGR